MNSIKTKLLAVVVPIICIALILVAYINQIKAKEFLEANFEKYSIANLEKTQEKLDDTFRIHIERLKGFAESSDVISGDKGQQQAFINRVAKEFTDYSVILIADLKGNTITSINKDINISERDYFQTIVSGSEFSISDPIISKVDNSTTIVFAVPINDDKGKTVGVLGGTFPIDSLQKLVSEVKVGETGYAFLTDENGMFIEHPNDKLVLEKSVSDLGIPVLETAIKDVRTEKTGSIRYIFEGIDKFTFYQKLTSNNWVLFIGVPTAEATSELSYLTKLSFVTVGIILVFSIIIIFIFSSRLVKPIQKMSHLTSVVAKGDLTLSVEHQAKDEIGILGANFNTMISGMQRILKQIHLVSDHVKQSSTTLVNSSEETKLSAEQVATAINELATGTTDIVNSVTSVTDKVQYMSNTLEDLSKFASEVNETSLQSKALSEKGEVLVNLAIDSIREVNNQVQETAEIIQLVDKRSTEIGNVIEIITRIAEQTNLLALNASIEAARAGDAGRGFAIVAEEVRKLASETNHSAERISNMISETQNESHRAVKSIDIGLSVVEEGMQAVIQSGEAFTKISENINMTSAQIEKTNNSIRNLEEVSLSITEDMESISAVTEQSSASAEEVSAASEQQAASAIQISNDAIELSNLSNELQEMMKQFKI